MPDKFLVVRFSSFGDIMQCLPAIDLIRGQSPTAVIHFATRADFVSVVRAYRPSVGNAIDQVWSLDRTLGFAGLFRLLIALRREHFTHVYDAHSNLRSHLISWGLRLSFSPPHFLRRSKERLKRLLLFKFRINQFETPYRGAHSYLAPLKKWFSNHLTMSTNLPSFDTDNVPLPWPYPIALANATVLVPGAAWQLKEWPAEKWRELIARDQSTPFVILGGKDDQICNDIAVASRALNLAGKLSWLQSLKVLSLAKNVIAGDTGLMHAADLSGHKTVAIIGPTAFGYPARASSKVLEIDLSCRPCTKDGRGHCHNPEFKACLTHISAASVSQALNDL